MPEVGDSATATLTVTPYSGSTFAALAVTAPNGTVTNPSTSSSDGGHTWTAAVPYTLGGWWLLAWTVTGTGAGVEYQQVWVSGAPPAVPGTTPLCASLEQFKTWLQFALDDETRDDELLTCLTSASEWAAWRIGGPLAVQTFTERVYANGCHIQQRHHPLVAVASITPQDGTALPATAYIVDTTNSQIELRGAFYGPHTLVYSAGLTAIRRGLRLAGMEVAKHLWNVQNGSGGRGFTPDEVTPTPFGFAIPNRAEELIGADPDYMDVAGIAGFA